MVRFLLMQYLNPSIAKTGYERWRSLSNEHRLTIKWAVVTALVIVLYFWAQFVMPENPTVLRYFLSLYVVNSAVFFLIFRDYPALGKTMLVFLVSLELVVALYYGFNYLGAGV